MSDALLPTAAKPASSFFPASRLAVSLLFLMNGFMVGAWAPKIPDFAERLLLSKSELGLMILLLGAGSLTLMPVAGALMARFGSARVAKGMAILLLPSLLLLTYAGKVWFAAVAIFWFGGFMGAMDVAMNTNAVAVEKSMGRAIMSSCHAFWSLGGLLGSSTGGLLISWFGVSVHAVVATAAAILMLVVAWPLVLPDAPHPAEKSERKRGLPLQPLPWILGVMALFSMVPEGAVLDWGAFYVRHELGADLVLSGFAFAAFSGTMAIMRFGGDLVRDRFGAVKTLRLSTLMALSGMLISGLAPNPEVAILGFAICGLGIANMVPIAFSAAGNIPGMAPGVGLSVATFMGYSGLLAAPSIIGFVAEHVGFAPVFLFLPVLLLVVLMLSGLARHADSIRH
ncbi:MFS transporter [Gellertiella hungarica]|uniref:MFS family permease n=1 Tax=Gellertiella hungarica TaxID=1572859 RepID=A0A7W6J5V5_9HYPH|nr:MFS family permease [Gellertiella hungarica]